MSPHLPTPAAVRIPRRSRSSAESLSGIWAVTLTSALLAGLYFGREVLVPLALAALITFLLAPVANRLERWLGRIAAVLVTMMLVLGGAVTLGWTLGRQAVDLAYQLPSYEENIRAKLISIQGQGSGAISKVSETMEDLKKDLPGAKDEGDLAGQSENEPMPVEVVDNASEKPMEMIRSMAAPVLGPLGMSALVILLATFMLLKRDDLQGRVIRLIGQGRISATTRAMNDAGTRVRKYLLMQLVVNVTYGIPLAIGLYFIGVPNAILWGALAAVLRFIPYIGPWIAAAFPILLSLAVAPSWVAPMMVISLFVVLELISNNVLEPWLYGSSTGVSPIALIIAAVFWTWLWGPVGLVMATPITVCLVVMGRHIPSLAFLSVVLGEEEALTPSEDFYRRLLKQGEHDEMELAEAFLKTNSLTELYDTMLIPVIIACEEDYRTGSIDADQHNDISQALTELVEDLEDRQINSLETADGTSYHPACRVQCLAARGERDRIAGAMAVHVLRQQGFDAANIPATRAINELIASLERDLPDLVCISVVEPSKAVHARKLCQRIRRVLPEQRIVVGLWGREENIDEDAEILREAGAEEIFTNVADLSAHADRLALHLAEQTEPPQRPEDEEDRLLALNRLGLVNPDREPVLDHITEKLARIFEAPMTAITLVDRERQLFKAHTGLPEGLAEDEDSPRDLSICGHVVAADGLVVVKDLQRDRRFAKNPMLTKHSIRFYAGVPIHASNGQPIGALCIMDSSPRGFSKREQRMLEENAAEVAEELERMAEIALPT